MKGCKEQFDGWLNRQEKQVELNLKWLKTQPHDVGRNKEPFEHFTEKQKKFAYRVWQVAWVLGQKNGRLQMQLRESLSDQELKDLWIKCGQGKIFGRAIERLHGIKER